MMIGDEAKAKDWMNNPRHLKKLQKENYEILKRLIDTNRVSVEPEHFHQRYKWNQVIKILNKFVIS